MAAGELITGFAALRVVLAVVPTDTNLPLTPLTLTRLTLAGEGAHLVVFALEAAVLATAARLHLSRSKVERRANGEGHRYQYGAQQRHHIIDPRIRVKLANLRAQPSRA